MNCEACRERLADFLLDELHESEAVLVQEHLNLCESCMRNYRELKGTGRALEAVPALRPIYGSPEFQQAVKANAAVELSSLVEKLPPDKRLRLEARRAARLSAMLPQPPQRPGRSWSIKWIAAVLAGVAALTTIALYPRGAIPAENTPLGLLRLSVGSIEQFYQKAGEPHTPVKDGKEVWPGDSYATLPGGRARFSFGDSTVLLGQASRITFRAPKTPNDPLIFALEAGELGVERELNEISEKDKWEVHTEAGTVILSPDCHAYINVMKKDNVYSGNVTVLKGSVEIHNRLGNPVRTVNADSKATLPYNSKIVQVEDLQNAFVPAWRAELVSENELSSLLGHDIKICGRQSGIQVELIYGRQFTSRGLNDWIGDSDSGAMTSTSDGVISLPARSRLHHAIPFTAPLAVSLIFSRDSVHDSSFAFGALECSGSGVSVDVAKNAAMQIHEKGRTVRNVSLPARTQPGKSSRLLLEIKGTSNACTTQITSDAANKSLPLDPHVCSTSGDVWVHALAEGILLDEIKINGSIPLDWLREHLEK